MAEFHQRPSETRKLHAAASSAAVCHALYLSEARRTSVEPTSPRDEASARKASAYGTAGSSRATSSSLTSAPRARWTPRTGGPWRRRSARHGRRAPARAVHTRRCAAHLFPTMPKWACRRVGASRVVGLVCPRPTRRPRASRPRRSSRAPALRSGPERGRQKRSRRPARPTARALELRWDVSRKSAGDHAELHLLRAAQTVVLVVKMRSRFCRFLPR